MNKKTVKFDDSVTVHKIEKRDIQPQINQEKKDSNMYDYKYEYENLEENYLDDGIEYENSWEIFQTRMGEDIRNKKSSYFDQVCSGTYNNTIKSNKDGKEDENEKEAEDMITLINTFLKFYKVHYENENCSNNGSSNNGDSDSGDNKVNDNVNESPYYMFQGIKESDSIGSTNRCIEMFQKYIDEYYENRDDDYFSSIFEIDDMEFNFTKKKSYILNINNKADKVSHTLLVLLKYVATIDVQDWIIDIISV